MKIQYLSDIHLEYYDLTKIPRILQQMVPQSNICVLAGDIGYVFQKSYLAFLKGMNSRFEHVFLIHGNHEYYQLKENKGKSMAQILAYTYQILEDHQLDNIHFLYRSHYDIGKYRFIGSTLWSQLDKSKMISNDIEFIYENSIENMNDLHEEERKYIDEALNQAKEDQKMVIMITHYLPSYQLNHPKYAKYVNHFHCFSSHSDDLIRDPVKLWIFGHTHAIMEKEVNGILCVANPIGYKGENLDVSFIKCVDVE